MALRPPAGPLVRRRSAARTLTVGLAIVLATTVAGCDSPSARSSQSPAKESRAGTSTSSSSPGAPAPPRPAAPLVVRAPAAVATAWRVVARVRGTSAAWLSRRAGVTVMRFDQRLVHITLHAGIGDGGEAASVYGERITPHEIHSLIAAFNGGFKLTHRDVGFVSGRHVAVPLKRGLGSIVTYSDGRTDVGAWREGVPRAGARVFSVLQNQRLLVDRGAGAANLQSCVIACWGETIGSRTVVARSGLGIRADGQLVWAAAEHLTPAGLAHALIAAGAQRAVELDINPDWVAGYLYPHHRSGPTAVPVVPEQHGIAGAMLEADPRDFLAVIADRR